MEYLWISCLAGESASLRLSLIGERVVLHAASRIFGWGIGFIATNSNGGRDDLITNRFVTGSWIICGFVGLAGEFTCGSVCLMGELTYL